MSADYVARGITASTPNLNLTTVGPNSPELVEVTAQALNASLAVLDNAAIIVAAPVSATSAGKPGQIAYDATHVYVCVAVNTWVRAALATF